MNTNTVFFYLGKIKMKNDEYDVIIVGGGIMGCCSAYYLLSLQDNLRIAIIERDPSYERASTTLSNGNIRHQFALKENIQISQYTFDVLSNFAQTMGVDGREPDVGFVPTGNLFIVDAKGRSAAQKGLAEQKKQGCDVHWLSAAQLSNRYDMFELDGYEGGTFCARDGKLDPYSMLMAYKANIRQMDGNFIKDEALSFVRHNNCVQGVALASGTTLKSDIIINCAGAWGPELAKTAGIEMPVLPFRRQVFVFKTRLKGANKLPGVFLPSGLYFQPESHDCVIMGRSMDTDPVGFNFNCEDSRFMETLWPELAEFVPAFEAIKMIRGWAGLYAVSTMDNNPFIGQWPELKGLYLVNGFSGHGLQQGPAVGRYVAEMILGQSFSLDLSIFRPERILDKKPICEGDWAIV